MTTALAKQQDFSRDQIDTIKATVARGANDAQLALFLQVCKSRNLDPFVKQVFYTPQGIIVSIDGFRAIAERTGCYAPGPTRYEYDEQKSLVAAFVTVKKLVAGQWFDVEESAYYEEYRGSSPIWKKMPRVMLAKCAESRALRRAFSSELSGLYSPEEMDQARDDRAGIPEAVVVEQPRVTVEQPRTEPAERSAAFVAAANAIEEAESMEALGAVAKRVKDAAAVLSHAENSELRSLYLQKRTVLGGAK